jgi:hypothetical protein
MAGSNVSYYYLKNNVELDSVAGKLASEQREKIEYEAEFTVTRSWK